MTSPMSTDAAPADIFKQDTRGRVRTPVERREALLEEFERSGVSGAEFARLAGLKYSSFQNWARRRRRGRAEVGVPSGMDQPGTAGASPVSRRRGPVRLFEAVVDSGGYGPGFAE